jgi:hypothetical protein
MGTGASFAVARLTITKASGGRRAKRNANYRHGRYVDKA